MEKADNIQEQMGSTQKDENSKRKSKVNAPNQNTVAEMKKNAFHELGLISRLDMIMERISEPEDMSIKISQFEMKKKKRRRREKSFFKNRIWTVG